jgi:release factor glutamine methyltransferase
LRAGARPVVVDLCCGAAPIGLAILAAGPASLYCTDIDPRAVHCARKNIGGRAEVLEGNILEPLPSGLRGRVDLIVANAPYVPSADIATLPREARDHEPALALDGGADGTAIQQQIATEAPAWLAPGGCLLTEASLAQSEIVAGHFASAGLDPSIEIDSDFEIAVICGTRIDAT